MRDTAGDLNRIESCLFLLEGIGNPKSDRSKFGASVLLDVGANRAGQQESVRIAEREEIFQE
jgi:hypothetical protein